MIKWKINSTDLFYIFVYINVFLRGIDLENNNKFYLILNILGMIAIGSKILKDKCNIKELFTIIIILLIGIFNLLITKKFTLLLACICLAGSKNINIIKLFKGIYKIRLVTFITMITFSFLGIVENGVMEMTRNGILYNRYTLGYADPNRTHMSLFFILVLYIYINYYKIELKNYIVMMLANIILYQFTFSRTGLIIISLLCLLCILPKCPIKEVKVIFRKYICKFPKYLYISMMGFSFIITQLYGKLPIIKKLDDLLSGRIYYSSRFLTNYGITLFGNNISQATEVLDNAYIALYITCGLTGLLLITWIIFKICKYIESNQDIPLAIILICYLTYFITELFINNIFMNVTLFFATFYIFKDKSTSTFYTENFLVKRRELC